MPVNILDEGQRNESFELAYAAWMVNQRKSCKGERKRRLSEVSNHAEKMFIMHVWWPAFGHFTHLHAEFEVKDFKDGWRYLDFAFITAGYRICIEIDSYGTHWRDLNRSQFSDHLMRQNHLVLDGWIVLRFALDDIMDKPRRCQQIIQQLIGILSITNTSNAIKLTPNEQLIMRIAASMSEPITPKYVTEQLGAHRATVSRYLQSLVQKQLLIPTRSDVRRVCSYRINKAMYPNVRVM